jgi:hypothetical protein
VITCPWRIPSVGVTQVDDMVRYRSESTPEMKDRFYGIVETTWSSPQGFINGYYGHSPVNPAHPGRGNSVVDCFKAVFQRIDSLGVQP